MQGQTEALISDTEIANCFEYKYLINKAVPLKNPVGEDITYDKARGHRFEKELDQHEWLVTHVTGSACYGHTNLVPEFCRVYSETTGNRVLAVHAAKGSTTIADWLCGSAGYNIIAEKAAAAIKAANAAEAVEHIFFVWLQGESDAICGNTKAYYKEKLAQINDALKNDIGIEKFGIIRVGRFTNDARDLEIISAQDEICLENSDFLMLTTIATELNAQKEYMNPHVPGHYSARGLEKLGAAAAKTLADYLK